MLTPKTPSPAVKRRSSGQPQSSGGRSGLKPPSAGIAKKETGQSLSAVSEPVAVVPEPKVNEIVYVFVILLVSVTHADTLFSH